MYVLSVKYEIFVKTICFPLFIRTAKQVSDKVLNMSVTIWLTPDTLQSL